MFWINLCRISLKSDSRRKNLRILEVCYSPKTIDHKLSSPWNYVTELFYLLIKRHITEIMLPNSAAFLKMRQILKVMLPNSVVYLKKRHITEIMLPNSAAFLKMRQILKVMLPNSVIYLEKRQIIKIVFPNSVVFLEKRQNTFLYKSSPLSAFYCL